MSIQKYYKFIARMMKTKKKCWYKSKTVWFNVMAIVGLMVQYASKKHLIGVEEQATIIALFNLVNRFFTSQSLEK